MAVYPFATFHYHDEQVEYVHTLLTSSLIDFIHEQLEKHPIDGHKENLTYVLWGSYKIGINLI